MNTKPPALPGLSRRRFLASTVATTIAAANSAKASTITGVPEWVPFAHNGPLYYDTPGWQFFTVEEARIVEAIVERLIPADELSISGKDAGCAVFIDRQLMTEYGGFDRLYMKGPFTKGSAEQGDQSPFTPRQRYRLGLSALQAHCQKTWKQGFEALSGQQQDELLTSLEKGTLSFESIDGKLFFSTVLTNTMEGFFADPVYGGNRDMVAWKMIGFPGARYDYRDYVDRHNEHLNLIPLAIYGSAAWQQGSKKA